MPLCFLNEWGDFQLRNAQRCSGVYFPLVNEGGMMSSVTPLLAGDCKTGQNTFLLAPASAETLHESRASRNFWVSIDGQPWSATGQSAPQQAARFTPDEEEAVLTAGLLWQRVSRVHRSSGLQAEVLSFVPAGSDRVEIMQVTLTNGGNAPLTLAPTAAVPTYGRSADNIRDHRHVTSLLHRVELRPHGLDVSPTLTFAAAGDPEEEKRRLEEAKEKSIEQLNALADKAREEAGEDSALLFETHAMFVEDEDFVDCMNAALEEERCTAERAVEIAEGQFAAMLAAMDDAYMQARAADIKDVARRILNNLMGVVEGGIDSEVPVILAADDLAPSETLQLDKSKILGFVTQGGSGNSHTAILARTMGIPAICGLGDALKPEMSGRTAYIDGETGKVAIEPDDITLHHETSEVVIAIRPTKREQCRCGICRRRAKMR